MIEAFINISLERVFLIFYPTIAGVLPRRIICKEALYMEDLEVGKTDTKQRHEYTPF